MIHAGKEYNKNVVVLTGQKSLTFAGVVDVINRTTDRFNSGSLKHFRFVLSWLEAVLSGDASFTHHLMAELLGRELMPADEVIRGLVIKNSDEEWHQKYTNSDQH
ncbi:hypothetical protein N7504_004854 [Penicillium tannophilum]|nr:hypothetical protein N7504_004854 [Penicillium tannophilum]